MSAAAQPHPWIPPEVLQAYAALERSAEIARYVAYLTGTDVIVLQDGRPMRESGQAVCDTKRPRSAHLRPVARTVR